MKKMLMEEKTTTTTRTVRPAASSATRELDDLMATLSDFKVSPFTIQLRACTTHLFVMAILRAMPTGVLALVPEVCEKRRRNLQCISPPSQNGSTYECGSPLAPLRAPNFASQTYGYILVCITIT